MRTIQISAIIILITSIFWICLFCSYDKAEAADTTTEATTEVTTEVTTEATTSVPQETTTEAKAISLGTFYITGYTPDCAHCCGKTDAIGASGRKIVSGKSVAMNRADMRKYNLKYGDKIYIDGIGERVIEDTGGFEQGEIDVACDSHDSCYKITGYYQVEVVG